MNERLQFRVLYRDFLFRMVDLELLSTQARGDMSKSCCLDKSPRWC